MDLLTSKYMSDDVLITTFETQIKAYVIYIYIILDNNLD